MSGQNQPPTLLMLSPLCAPIRRARTQLQELGTSIQSTDDKWLLHGAFVLAIAACETALHDTLIYYLQEFPQKLNKQTSVAIADWLQGQPVLRAVERHVSDLSYRDFPGFIDAFCKTLSIGQAIFPKDLHETLKEMKETRNLLLHAGLSVNSRYIEKAGPRARSIEPHCLLTIPKDYIANTLTCCSVFLTTAEEAIRQKYANYTRAAAFRRLWDWIYDKNSPACLFEDYWEVSDDGRGVHAIRTRKTEAMHFAMSGSERMFLWVMRTHYNSDDRDIEPCRFDLGNLDNRTLFKMHFLLGNIRKLSLASGVEFA